MKNAVRWFDVVIFVNLLSVASSYDHLEYSYYLDSSESTVNYHLNCTFFDIGLDDIDDVKNINKLEIKYWSPFYRVYVLDAQESKYVQVKEVHFDNCVMFDIPLTFFQRLGSVDEIYVENSGVNWIAGSAFPSGSVLKRLSMQRNNIIELPESLFAKTTQLSNIDFAYNHIDKIHAMAFKGTEKSLRRLNLTHNHIKQLEKETFQDFNRLTVLDLSHNLIETVQLALSRLQTLNLSFNKIQELNADSFGKTANLRYLYLNNNQLTRINDGTFANFKKLMEIHLNDNLLAELTCIDSILSTSKVWTRFTVSNNQLDCGSLSEFVQRNPKVISSVLDSTAIESEIRNVDGITCLEASDSMPTATEANLLDTKATHLIEILTQLSENISIQLMKAARNSDHHSVDELATEDQSNSADGSTVVANKLCVGPETVGVNRKMNDILNALQSISVKLTEDQTAVDDKITKLEKSVEGIADQLSGKLMEIQNGLNARFDDINNRIDFLT